MSIALLTGLGAKYESVVKTFDNLDDCSLQQVKIKLASREERLKQAKAVTEAKARKQAIMKWFDNSRKKAQMQRLIKFAIMDAQSNAQV
ncbi:hypothetical protein PR003_g24280 [Phytophthora rubi]|uniref:Uncharacterized protein n=1 Tax=Phytophthora rubi TaxID=129364 RepID=A0A6A4CUT9_9STRA|nr:hypothetical protein PR001_g23271 [Phytophthora rubi]KAE9294353.1 hypothetical protein PR003_g24280 [Phytophthora rubi]